MWHGVCLSEMLCFCSLKEKRYEPQPGRAANEMFAIYLHTLVLAHSHGINHDLCDRLIPPLGNRQKKLHFVFWAFVYRFMQISLIKFKRMVRFN